MVGNSLTVKLQFNMFYRQNDNFLNKVPTIFERFIQLGKHVKIAIIINITGAFG